MHDLLPERIDLDGISASQPESVKMAATVRSCQWSNVGHRTDPPVLYLIFAE